MKFWGELARAPPLRRTCQTSPPNGVFDARLPVRPPVRLATDKKGGTVSPNGRLLEPRGVAGMRFEGLTLANYYGCKV